MNVHVFLLHSHQTVLFFFYIVCLIVIYSNSGGNVHTVCMRACKCRFGERKLLEKPVTYHLCNWSKWRTETTVRTEENVFEYVVVQRHLSSLFCLIFNLKKKEKCSQLLLCLRTFFIVYFVHFTFIVSKYRESCKYFLFCFFFFINLI